MKGRKGSKLYPVMLQLYVSEAQVALLKRAAAKAAGGAGGMFTPSVSGYVRASAVAAAELLLGIKKKEAA